MIITGAQNENQRTDEWVQSRMGRFSCSQLHRLMTEPKSKSRQRSWEAIRWCNHLCNGVHC
jgi:hypothetical protein